jgi:hypothetical protein
MYHFEYGVYDRQQAGLTVLPASLAADLPASLEFVAYPRADYPLIMLQALPGFSASTMTDDWRFYRRRGVQ